MWKKIFIGVMLLALMVSLTACTSNTSARYYGGTTTINLDHNRKFIDITWKDDNLWVLTKPMTEDDIAETYRFEEDCFVEWLIGLILVKLYANDCRVYLWLGNKAVGANGK